MRLIIKALERFSPNTSVFLQILKHIYHIFQYLTELYYIYEVLPREQTFPDYDK